MRAGLTAVGFEALELLVPVLAFRGTLARQRLVCAALSRHDEASLRRQEVQRGERAVRDADGVGGGCAGGSVERETLRMGWCPR